MKIRRFAILMIGLAASASAVSAQSYYDDDIYYDASKDKAAKTVTTKAKSPSNTRGNYAKAATYGNNSATVMVADYPSADNYTVTGTRNISVDDYNRRGIFASDSLSADTTATDFQYTRRIEQYYNPEIVSGSGDEDLAQIYYMEPQTVNVYVNTPSVYWGYDYFYPSMAWSSPYYWNNYWRWNSGWYWNSWYDPYWAWGWGPSWAWGPSWSWGWNHGPSWGWGWNHGWGRPYNPRHPGAVGNRPGNHWAGSHPINSGSRPGITNGGRHQSRSGWMNNNTNRPNYNGSTGRPGVRPNASSNGNRNNGYSRPNNNSNRNNGYSRPNNTNNNHNYSYPQNTNGGRSGGFNSGGSRGGYSNGGFSGGGRSSGGGRGRH